MKIAKVEWNVVSKDLSTTAYTKGLHPKSSLSHLLHMPTEYLSGHI